MNKILVLSTNQWLYHSMLLFKNFFTKKYVSQLNPYKPTSFLWNICEHCKPRWGATEFFGIFFGLYCLKRLILSWIKMRIHLNNPLNGNGLVQSTQVRNFINYKYCDTLWRCQACTRFYASLKAPTWPKKLKILQCHGTIKHKRLTYRKIDKMRYVSLKDYYLSW